MTWTFIFSLAACAYGLKLLGAVIIGHRTMPEPLQRCLLLIPAALLAGLITKDTFTTAQSYAIDARGNHSPHSPLRVSGVARVATVRLRECDMSSSTLLLVLDLVGIAVFALSGGLVGVEKKLDIFGVLAIAATSALGGGIIRDVLLGLAPPATFTDARYLFVPLVCGVFVFYVHPAVARLHRPLIVLDAAGLGLFAVAGAKKALDAGLNAPASVGIGMLTAIGGGVLRDLLVSEIPTVLHREIYATAAVAGAIVVVVGDSLDLNSTAIVVVGAIVTFAIRVISKWRGWSAPRPA